MDALYGATSLNKTFCPKFSTYRDSYVLEASVAQTVTVPTGARYVLFNITGGADFWVDIDTTAAVPGAITNGTAPELNPEGRAVTAGDTFSVLSATASILQLSYYS